MKIVKPSWHKGAWTVDKQMRLIAELTEVEMLRSLTKEEREWMSKVKDF